MRWIKGKTATKWYPKKASTAFSVGDMVYFDGSGNIQPADSTSGDHVGIIKKAIASTDSDYAANTKVPVEIPLESNCEFESEASGLTAAKVGTTMDLTDANTVNGGATSKNVVTLVGYISATKGKFVLNSQYAHLRVATT